MSDHANPSAGLPRTTPGAHARYGWAWVPIPVLLLTILALRVADLRGVHESRALMVLLNVFFTWLASLCICVLAARGFLHNGRPGLLMFGCGSLLWGVTSLSAAVVVDRVNATITVHNVGVLGAAVCHFVGWLWPGRVARPGRWLVVGYAGALLGAAVIFGAALAGLTPVFFVQGQGGTLIRYAVLVSAVVLFAFVAWQMVQRSQQQAGAFYHWYGLGLGLVATGLTGVTLLTVQGGVLGWTNRLTQCLGSAYLFVAALAAARDTGAWRISLEAAQWDDRLLRVLTPHQLWSWPWGWRYGLAVAIAMLATVLRWALLPWLGPVVPYNVAVFAIVITTILLGIGPGLLCLVLADVAVEVFIVGSFATGPDGTTLARLAFSLAVGAFVAGILHGTRVARLKSQKSEARLNALYASMTEGMASHDVVYAGGLAVDYILTDVNPAFERITGIARERAVGARASALFGSGAPPYLDLYARVAESGKPQSFETDFAPMGKSFHISVFSPGQGRFATVFEDITERKQAEEVLRVSEARLGEANAELQQRVAQEQGANAALREARHAAVNLMKEAVASRQRAEQAGAALQLKEADLREAQRVAHVGSWHWDAQTDVTTGSDELLRIYGLDPATQTMPDFNEQRGRCYPAEDWERVNAAVQKTLATGVGYELDVRALRNGTTIWVTTRSEVVRDATGQIAGLRGTVQDISVRKEAEAVLARSKEELERLVAERTAKLQELVGELEHFSYTITHDMRAPLRAMRGFGEFLNDLCAECEHSERKDFLRKIITSAGRMDRLITDALNYSRSVRQELPVEEVDTGALLRGMLDSYPEFQSSKAQIRVEGALPVVLGNEAGLTQCFSNLLGNAVKFVKPGETPDIRVWAELVQSPKSKVQSLADGGSPRSAVRGPESEGEWVRIWVEDKGIGISKSMLARVFDMFSRGSSSREGTGIGLALVRKVTQRMGGRVGVESEEGKGSRFWLELRGAERGLRSAR